MTIYRSEVEYGRTFKCLFHGIPAIAYVREGMESDVFVISWGSDYDESSTSTTKSHQTHEINSKYIIMYVDLIPKMNQRWELEYDD